MLREQPAPSSKNNFLKWEPLLAALLVVAVSALAYLTLAGQTGYYRDDWHVAWTGFNRGFAMIAQEHQIDRPFMGLVYAQVYRLVGDSPLAWYLFAWVMRVVGALGFFWLLRQLWPARRFETTLMAALFVVYPGFLQLPTASSYENHLMGLAAGIISLALTVRIVQSRRRVEQILLTPLAMLSALFCFGIMEYMIGLEGVRLALLVYLFWRETCPSLRAVLRGGWVRLAKKTILFWLPNLAALGMFLFWRVVIFKSARAVTDVGSLKDTYLLHPLEMISRLGIETVKDTFESIVLAWGVPFYNLTARAAYADWLAAILFAALGVALLVMYIRGLKTPEKVEDPALEKEWALPAVWTGLFSVVVTLFPVVLSNRDVRFTDTFDRYTLPASLGVVMLVVGGLSLLLKRAPRRVVFASLLAVAVITQYNDVAFYRDNWNMQRQLWWQMTWRAPQLKEGTLLVAYLPEPFRLAEDYEIWGPANTIYYPRRGEMAISAEVLNTETVTKIQQGAQDNRPFRTMDLQRDFRQLLLVTIDHPGACLHVVDGQQIELPVNADPLVRLAAPYSHTSHIDAAGKEAKPLAAIFGQEPQRGWCYYYQKASLARQQGNWQEVARLGEEASQQGLAPADASEWLPFYEAAVRQGQAEQAAGLAEKIRADEQAVNMFCSQFSGSGAASQPAAAALCKKQ